MAIYSLGWKYIRCLSIMPLSKKGTIQIPICLFLFLFSNNINRTASLQSKK